MQQTTTDGGCSLISFETGDVQLSQRFVEACKILKITVSFGSVNSLVEMPTAMSHASIPAELCTLPKDLVRMSCGIEDVRDIQADIAQALQLASRETLATIDAPKVLWGGDVKREKSFSDSVAEDGISDMGNGTGSGRFDSKFEDLPENQDFQW